MQNDKENYLDSAFNHAEFYQEWYIGYRKIVESIQPTVPVFHALSNSFLIVLTKCSYCLSLNMGIHIIVNPYRPFSEMHYLLSTDKNSKHKQLTIGNEHDYFGIPLIDNDFWNSAAEYFTNIPVISVCDNVENSTFWKILKKIGLPLPKKVSIVRFSVKYSSHNFNLGVGFFWNSDRIAPCYGLGTLEQEHKEMFINDMSRLLASSFTSVLGALPNTYLPSYREICPKKVVILFADIRSFTSVTELLRNRSKSEYLTNLINTYCKRMGNIISQYGRVDKFIGDGIMAVFGEYSDSPKEICATSLLCAHALLKEFSSIREEWMHELDINAFMKENNENIDFQLGIGMNYGEVHFDYYGSENQKSYSAIGTTVNLAQRLESTAAHLIDIQYAKREKPIVLSQTFFINLTSNDKISKTFNIQFLTGIQRTPVFLEMKGLPSRYPCYFIDVDEIQYSEIERYLNQLHQIDA